MVVIIITVFWFVCLECEFRVEKARETRERSLGRLSLDGLLGDGLLGDSLGGLGLLLSLGLGLLGLLGGGLGENSFLPSLNYGYHW